MPKPSFEDRKAARDRGAAEAARALRVGRGMKPEEAERKGREIADRAAREADEIFEKRDR